MARGLLWPVTMRRFAATFITALALLMAPQLGASAQAGEVPPVAPIERTAPVERTWYGWQILLADAASIACAAITEHGECIVGLALSGPVVHSLHGHVGRGFASLGLRVGLPLLGGIIGASFANCPEQETASSSSGNGHGAGYGTVAVPSFCGLSEMGIGMMIGAAGAIAVDGIWAFTDGAPVQESPRPSRYALSPRLAVGQNNVAAGIGGTF
jgi:hypothetical protein